MMKVDKRMIRVKTRIVKKKKKKKNIKGIYKVMGPSWTRPGRAESIFYVTEIIAVTNSLPLDTRIQTN
jgi:hypothetical protein